MLTSDENKNEIIVEENPSQEPEKPVTSKNISVIKKAAFIENAENVVP